MKLQNILKIGCSRFIYGENALEGAADEILRYGTKAYFVGGSTATEIVMNKIKVSLASKKISYCNKILNEPNSVDCAKRFAKEANDGGYELIVGIGGGKCMDLTKVVSDMAGVPLITIPTSVATCAGSSAVSIMYTPDVGRYDQSIPKAKEVDSVIADLTVIGNSPRRLFASGIMDSMAKLPELANGRSNICYENSSLTSFVAYSNSILIYDFLSKYGLEVYKNPTGNPQLLNDLVLINLIVTSMVSGFSSGSNQLAIAHGLYDGVRKLFPVESKNSLHGEIVAVGILIQMKYNKAPQKDFDQVKAMMKEMNMPLTIADIGIDPNQENIRRLKEYNVFSNKITKQEDINRLNQSFSAVL